MCELGKTLCDTLDLRGMFERDIGGFVAKLLSDWGIAGEFTCSKGGNGLMCGMGGGSDGLREALAGESPSQGWLLANTKRALALLLGLGQDRGDLLANTVDKPVLPTARVATLPKAFGML